VQSDLHCYHDSPLYLKHPAQSWTLLHFSRPNPIKSVCSQLTSSPIHKYLILNRICKLCATNYSNVDFQLWRSIVHWLRSYGFTRSLPSIRVIYKMRNISKRNKQVFSELSGFLDISISGHSAKNYENRPRLFWGRWWGIFFRPPVIPPILDSGSWKLLGP